MNPSGNLLASALRSMIFLTLVSVRAVLGFGFKVNVSGA